MHRSRVHDVLLYIDPHYVNSPAVHIISMLFGTASCSYRSTAVYQPLVSSFSGHQILLHLPLSGDQIVCCVSASARVDLLKLLTTSMSGRSGNKTLCQLRGKQVLLLVRMQPSIAA